MPFHIRDLSIHEFWYLWRSWSHLPVNTERFRLYTLHVCVCVYVYTHVYIHTHSLISDYGHICRHIKTSTNSMCSLLYLYDSE